MADVSQHSDSEQQAFDNALNQQASLGGPSAACENVREESVARELFGHSGAEGPDVRQVADVAAAAAANAHAQISTSRATKVTDYADEQGNRLSMPRGFVIGLISVIIISLIVAVSAVYFIFFSQVRIDSITFPDQALLAYAHDNLDPDDDGMMTRDEVRAVEEMSIDGLTDTSDLMLFNHLRYLTLTGDNLVRFAMPGAMSLTDLDCHGMSNLREINVTGCSNLARIDISGTGIRTIDLSGVSNLECIVCDEDVEVRNLPASAERLSS